MRFFSEQEAREYWLAAYQLSGGGHTSFAEQLELFRDWIEDQGITWLDEHSQDFVREFEPIPEIPPFWNEIL